MPSLKLRRAWVKKSARFVFLLCGIKMNITGQENIPEGNALIVANHASYLDGIILHAVLPTKFTFVIKSEMQSVPIANFLFNRVGSRFVERFQPTGSFRDARKLIKAGSDGESLAIFPEGTFTENPGLDRFRTGAFATAMKSEMPLVPLVIIGSRKILPANKFLPNTGNLCVHILETIDTNHEAFNSSKELKKLSRERILKVLGEPDLLHSK
ncbi:MAG: lysophospholipid acyltransferase family protein [Pseudomonadota bacterium]|nr:lysophospholipid acyltransferase family protein [Pseudomonadota bacterium]